MKIEKEKKNKNFLKKIFIKVCRIFGYEIIDQSNFFVPTQNKSLNENFVEKLKSSKNQCSRALEAKRALFWTPTFSEKFLTKIFRRK